MWTKFFNILTSYLAVPVLLTHATRSGLLVVFTITLFLVFCIYL